MRKHSLSVPAVLLALAAVTAWMSLGLRTDAQQVTEVLRLRAGDTLELSTDTAAQNPQFSWILTRDRKFQSAQRSRFFQTRFAQAGAYVLDVSVQNSGGSANDYRAFTLAVDEAMADTVTPPVSSETAPLQASIRTEPPVFEGKVYLPAGGGMLKIDPSASQGKITSYDLDLDSAIDTDGDGNPTNDKDTRDTLSQKNGTPVYVYVLPKDGMRTVTLSVTNLSEPNPSALSFEVLFGITPPAGAIPGASSSLPSSGTSVSGGAISAETSGLTVTFRSNLDPALTAGKELLYTWDFGDRGKSLLNTPTHTYVAAGSYPVTLTVTDIATGQIFTTSNGAVTVVAPVQTSSSSSSSQATLSSVSSSETGSTPSDGSGLPVGAIITVGIIILLLLALAIGLYAVIHWIKSKATGKLQDTLEKMEQTIVKKDAKAEAIEGTVEPMKLKKDAAKLEAPTVVREKEMAKTEFTSSTRTNETPSANVGPVPSWLAKAGAPASSASTPAAATAAPMPTEQKTPDWLKPQASPTPKQVAPAPTPTPAAATTAPVPDWLKPKAPAPIPAVTPAPKPVAPSAPVQTPVPAPAPAPATPKTETPVVPDWLKPKSPAPASPAPATTTVPVAPPVVTPKPTEAPKPQQAPVKTEAPKPQPKPAAEPVAQPQPQPVQAPVVVPEQKKPVQTPSAEKPKADVPKPQNETKSEPKKEEPKKPQTPATPTSVPVQLSATPAPQPKASLPIEPLTKVSETQTPPDDDQTIAIIQADSLTK